VIQNKLRYEETAMPKYGDNEVLVEVRATSINPIDVKIRSGAAKSRFSIEFPAILGRDLSGEVAETGRNVQGFPKGMRVMALANGTYAEYTVAKADVLAPIPEVYRFPDVVLASCCGYRSNQTNPRKTSPDACCKWDGRSVLMHLS
jgi:NADPH:quinone reductase-like Zn-dependent oxidoreductase